MKFQYRLGLLIACLGLSHQLMAQRPVNGHKPQAIQKEAEIRFANDLATAIKQAKSTGKPIFVDGYATWCGPCRQLKAETFKDPQVACFFNQNFVNASIDMEKGNGPNLATKWEVQEYPTLLVIDGKGDIILRSIGFLDAKQLLEFGKKALQLAKTR